MLIMLIIMTDFAASLCCGTVALRARHRRCYSDVEKAFIV